MKSSKLRVLFLATGNAGTAFYRMWQYREGMKNQKLAETAIPYYNYDNIHASEWQWHIQDDFNLYHPKGVLPKLCEWADVVVVQYLHTFEALALMEAIKACLPNTPFFTEIDDDIFDTPTSNPAFDAYEPGKKYREVAIEQIKALDGVICSTPFLAEKCREINDNVYIVPNGIDFNIWDRVKPVHAKNEVRIGWAGGANHEEDLRTVEVPLKAFLKAHKNVTFHVVHGIPDFFKNQSKIVCHPHYKSINKYPKYLGKMGFDIGLAPLVPNDFNLAKSNLRKLEYAALGIPVLAANVGEFARTINHSKDGFLYSNADEFYNYLELLVTDKDLREKMGQANREDVRQNFNVKKISRDYFQILKEITKTGPVKTVDVSERSEAKWTEQHVAGTLA